MSKKKRHKDPLAAKLKLDRTGFSVVPRAESDDAIYGWARQTPQALIGHLEIPRRRN